MDKRAVEAAMAEEMTTMEEMDVWCDEKPPPGTKVIPTKWVLVTKGDPPEVRARLVACEVKHEKGSEAAFFVATPPIDALRCIISGACHDQQTTLDLVDVRKAHLNGLARRALYVRLPDGRVVRLLRALYGTRDAAVCWEECIREFMLERNFVQGKTSPCIFVHVERNLRVCVHGDAAALSLVPSRDGIDVGDQRTWSSGV